MHNTKAVTTNTKTKHEHNSRFESSLFALGTLCVAPPTEFLRVSINPTLLLLLRKHAEKRDGGLAIQPRPTRRLRLCVGVSACIAQVSKWALVSRARVCVCVCVCVGVGVDCVGCVGVGGVGIGGGGGGWCWGHL